MKKTKPPKGNPPPNAGNQGREKEDTNRHVYVEPGVQIDLVEDLKDTYKTAQTDSTTHNNKQLFWTKVASILLVITAICAGVQGYYSSKSADATKIAAEAATSAAKTADQTLRMQQRSRLTISFPPATHSFGSPTVVHAVLTNTGATPSKKMAGAIFVRFINLNDHISFDLQKEWETKHDGIAIHQHAIYPNVPTSLPLPLRSVDPKTGANSPIPYTREMHAHITSGDSSIVIFGKIEYSDVFSDNHWLTFCYFAKNSVRENKTTAEQDCSEYNDIDN